MPGLFVKRDCAWSSSICDKSGRFLWYFFWNSLSLKLSMPGVAGFFLLLGTEVPSLGLVTNLGLWQKSKGFESRALVTEATRTGFSMLVLSKLMWLDLSKLCARLCILEKTEEKHILFCESNIFENSAFAVWIQAPRDTSWNLVGNSWSEKVYVWGLPKICKGSETPLNLVAICLNPSQFVTACRPPCWGLLGGTLRLLWSLCPVNIIKFPCLFVQ